MTLKDISNGPDWIIWIVGILFAIVSFILISGHGAKFYCWLSVRSESSLARSIANDNMKKDDKQ